MVIGFNVVEAARLNGVKKLMNLGSTCIYPKMAEQPIKEESLLTDPLEPTNDAYALAKISVIKLCTAYNMKQRQVEKILFTFGEMVLHYVSSYMQATLQMQLFILWKTKMLLICVPQPATL